MGQRAAGINAVNIGVRLLKELERPLKILLRLARIAEHEIPPHLESRAMGVDQRFLHLSDGLALVHAVEHPLRARFQPDDDLPASRLVELAAEIFGHFGPHDGVAFKPRLPGGRIHDQKVAKTPQFFHVPVDQEIVKLDLALRHPKARHRAALMLDFREYPFSAHLAETAPHHSVPAESASSYAAAVRHHDEIMGLHASDAPR